MDDADEDSPSRPALRNIGKLSITLSQQVLLACSHLISQDRSRWLECSWHDGGACRCCRRLLGIHDTAHAARLAAHQACFKNTMPACNEGRTLWSAASVNRWMTRVSPRRRAHPGFRTPQGVQLPFLPTSGRQNRRCWRESRKTNLWALVSTLKFLSYP